MSKQNRWMAVEYSLEWLLELLTDQLNYKKNSIGERVQAHSYLYRVEFVSTQKQDLLVSAEKSKRIIPIVRITKDLSTFWYYQRLRQLPWPPGVSEMPTTQRDDEEYELHIYTKYLLENIFSFFWPQVGDASQY